MSRRHSPDSAVSFRLEEPIDVPFQVIGTKRWIEECVPSDFPPNQLWVAGSPRDLRPSIDYLRQHDNLSVDSESSGPLENDGLDPVSPSSKIVLFQIGTPRMMYVIEPKLIVHYREILEGERQLKILQHAVHDFRFFLAKYGIHVVHMYCTMLAEQVLTAGKEGVGVGLADLVRKYDPHYLISKNTRDDFIHFKGRFTKEMLFYAARDVFLLFKVFDAQKVLLQKQELGKTAIREFRIIAATAEMGLTGVWLDRSSIQQTIDYYTRQQTAALAKIFQIYNGELKTQGLVKVDLLGEQFETWNLKSHQETGERLRRIGLDVEKTDYDTMIRLPHPIGRPLADYSGYTKVLDNYGESMLARIHWHTRRLHPHFDQLGAGEGARRNGKDKKETIATGRFSSDFQQLPRPEKNLEVVTGEHLKRVRAAFAGILDELERKKAA